MNEIMKRSAFLTSLLLLLTSLSGAVIVTYKDSGLTQPATEFGDGDKVYFTVTEPGITGGTRTVTVTSNGSSVQSVTVSAYDHGLYYDKTAEDGIFSGMFIVTTKLTIMPDNAESNSVPQGLCYKIVPNIHIDKDGTAHIEADFDSNGSSQTASVKLLTLFNVEARAIADTSVVIFWNTSDSGYSQVEYGLSASYGNSVIKATPTKDLALSHYITLTGLMPGTLYHYKVTSIDTYGNSPISGDYTFTTKTSTVVEAAIRAARKDGGLPKTYYVKTDGNDANDGLTIATAWQHPSVAVSTADAGDTIYLMNGTWNGEHLVFNRSGIDIAPITLTSYGNGMAVLDGGDKTGIGIRAANRSYIAISGIHLRNYNNGMSFESLNNGMKEIRLNNFIEENMQQNSIQFANSSYPISDVSISGFEMYNAGSNPAIDCSGKGQDFTNFEIYDFYIHDTPGKGIFLSYIDRQHVNDGRTCNINGGEGVGFNGCTYNSIMENIVVANTGWHGVSIWDWTVGNCPCFNNTIRNCDISYAIHNHIDLHSGAFNTLVENNTLHDQEAGGTNSALFFHNRGAGLIARNNHIYNSYTGIKTGSISSNYPLIDMVITSNTVHNCSYWNIYLEASNQIFSGNTVYNDASGADVLLSGNNILIEGNDIDETGTYRVNCGTGVVRNPRDTVYNVKSAYGAFVTLEYIDNTVYNQRNGQAYGTFVSSPVYTPSKSYSTLCSSTDTYIAAAITAYPMTARPVSSTGTVTVSTFNVTLPLGQYQVVFLASVADNTSPMDFTVKSLVPWAWYEVQKDSVAFIARQLNATGSISFSNTSWTGTHRFGLKRIPDTVAPVISDVKVISVSDTGMRVQWATNEPADSRIEYGKTAEYGSTTTPDTRLTLTHSQNVTGLMPGWYHFRVISRDPSGNESVSGDYTVLVNNGGRQMVVPNPYIKGKSRGSKVVFENLPAGAVVRIYAVSGEPVTTLVHDAASGELNEEWDVSNMAGGIYFYTISAGGTTTKGKLGIVK